MSNYLAIATVTAVLQQMLQTEVGRDVPGVQVTTVRPDSSGSTITGACINIYLYQATPNPAWRNADLRTRRPKGDLIKHSQAGLDLHYLFTFYGNEQELEPQRLMGSTIRALVDQPLLTEAMIAESIATTTIPTLADSSLGDQVQQVKFIPSTITTEDLSRIWSVFFQVPYSLSFAYQATAVLIQGERSGQVALPVRQRATTIAVARPVLRQVEHYPPDQAKGLINTITLNSRIVVHGRDLAGAGNSFLQIGKARLTPQVLSEWDVSLAFEELAAAEQDQLRAGGQGLQVVRTGMALGDRAEELAVESNLLPFVLSPQIVSEGMTVNALTVDDEGRYSGTVQLQVDVQVDVRQRVFLLLNGTSRDNPDTYIFRAHRRRSLGRELGFEIQGVLPGEYLVRVQIDGAESPLLVNEQNHYVGPRLVIA